MGITAAAAPPAPAGEVALVTGATSGIGRAICLTLAAAGCRVIPHYWRSRRAAYELAESLAPLDEPVAVRADLGEPRQVAEMFAFLGSATDGVSILVNNGSYSSPALWNADPLSIPLGEWRRCLDVDLTGCYQCCREAIPMMLRRGHGKIVNMSSSGALTGDVGTLAYPPAKAAVAALSRTLAKAYAPTIQVNTIAPGSIDTGWIERWGLTATEIGELKAMRGMPKRLGSSQEVAELAAFLVSSKADYLTGQVLSIDGGTAL